MNWELASQPLLAGLSAGVFCLTYCFPFMGVFFGAEERSPKKNLFILLEFLAGRLAGYLCFGLLAGYLGEKFDSKGIRTATDISFIALSLVLFFYLFGLMREKNLCPAQKLLKAKSAGAMGFFMGINLCPPFLLSVAYVFRQRSPLYGMFYFALFFLASSVYFLPLLFVGFVSKIQALRTAARVSGFLVASIFFIYGIYSIVHNWQ
jgi:sulfite exporter TauE/SafE